MSFDRKPSFSRSLAAITVAAMSILATTVSCSAPSFLVTPVSSRRQLVETELSRESFLARDKIALIDVSGTIQNSETGFFLSPGDNPVSLLLEQLDAARRDKAVKAVILRINSPGGTVVASELMHDEITYFRKTTGKPVVAVMMDVAASGGYYVACACDEIVAQPSTVTGSIGVIMLLFDATGTMNMIGIKGDAITSGPFKDAGSPFRTMKPEEREWFQKIVLDMYERFVKVVVAGRPKLDEAAVRKLADGRVYTANQALEVGLVDRVATLRDTIDSVKTRVRLSAVRVVVYARPYDYRPNYYATAPTTPGATNINLLHINLPSSILPLAPQFLYLWAPGH